MYINLNILINNYYSFVEEFNLMCYVSMYGYITSYIKRHQGNSIDIFDLTTYNVSAVLTIGLLRTHCSGGH